ncbi:hypothetical protein ACKWTF_015883 [Chironomus riparius]
MNSALPPILLITICMSLSLVQVYTQINTTQKQNDSVATCVYEYDYKGRYSCMISSSSITIDPNDVMEITGNHLDNKTDSDVLRASLVIIKIPQFNGEIMKKFKNLKYFEITMTETQKIHETAFESCSHLEELEISSMPLTMLPSKLFKNCENLKIFTITNTKISTLPVDLFGLTTKLEIFHVSYNQIVVLPPGLLLNMKNLISFNALHNALTEIDEIVFKNASKLEYFSISENLIADIEPVMNMLSGSLNLKFLGLEDNNLELIDFSLFTKYQKLERLSIGNRFKLNITNWDALPIQINDLAVEGIADNIPETGMHAYRNLSRLALGGPGITDLKKDTFKGQENLNFLHLRPTSLTSLHPEIFKFQSNLTALILEYSLIEELPESIFAPLSKLGTGDYSNSLSIRHSQIKKLNVNSFGQHPGLNSLDLSFNQINAIERGVFSRFNLSISHLDFSGNLCASNNVYGKYDLDHDEMFEKCFENWDNWDEITATTPGSGHKIIFNGFLIIFAGSFWIF